jgi:hypothetical protein
LILIVEGRMRWIELLKVAHDTSWWIELLKVVHDTSWRIELLKVAHDTSWWIELLKVVHDTSWRIGVRPLPPTLMNLESLVHRPIVPLTVLIAVAFAPQIGRRRGRNSVSLNRLHPINANSTENVAALT